MDDINYSVSRLHGFEFRAGFGHGLLYGSITQTFRQVEPAEIPPIAGDRIIGWVDDINGMALLAVDSTIVDVEQLYFDFTGSHEPVACGGKILTRSEREALAMGCGFREFKQMAMFVIDQYGHMPVRCWLIKWEQS